MSHPFADYEPIFAALKEQSFEVEKTGKGHFRAKSPDKTKPLVFFSVTSESRAIKNTIRDLKRAGFVWNEVEKEEPMFSMPAVPAFPMFKASDLKAKPSEPSEPPPDMDALFKALKSEKENAQFCEECESDALAQLQGAQENFDRAQKETHKARAALAFAKKRFDEFFATGEKRTA